MSTLLRAAVAVFLLVLCGEASAEPLKISIQAEPNKDDLNARLLKNIRCIRDTIYTEARGESSYAQAMVGYVVVARWHDRRREWGDTPCKVAYRLDVRNGELVSQFAGNIHNPAEARDDDPEQIEIARIAIRVLLGYFSPLPEHQCARAYQRKKHADANRQGWFKTLVPVGLVDKHEFYCLPTSKLTRR